MVVMAMGAVTRTIEEGGIPASAKQHDGNGLWMVVFMDNEISSSGCISRKRVGV